jgi:hypothetical protein
VTSNGAPAGSVEPAEIDTSVAHAARVYDYLLGGRANFKVDREAAELLYATWPGGVDGVRADVRQSRAALGRVVRYFARDSGVTQFLDIGTGIPKQNNVHEVAQHEARDARIVYADNDPIVLAHAHQLLRGTDEGVTRYVYGDLRDPAPILREAAKTLDFSRPTAVILFGILHLFSDADHPRAVIEALMAPLAVGSGLAVSHLGSDLQSEEMAETFERVSSRMAEQITLRSHDEVAALLDGFELVEPGVVPASHWRPDLGAAVAPSQVWCAVARKVG